MDTRQKYCVSDNRYKYCIVNHGYQSQILCIVDTRPEKLCILHTGHKYYISWILCNVHHGCPTTMLLCDRMESLFLTDRDQNWHRAKSGHGAGHKGAEVSYFEQ